MLRSEKINAALTEKVRQLNSRVEQAIEETTEVKLTLKTVQGLFEAAQRDREEMKNFLNTCGIDYVPGKTRLTYQELRRMRKIADDGIDRITAKMTADITGLKRKYEEVEKSLNAVREISARLNTTVQQPVPQQVVTPQPTQTLQRSLYTSLVLAHASVTKHKMSKIAKKDPDDTDDESAETAGKFAKEN